jgi:hypothetical protein
VTISVGGWPTVWMVEALCWGHGVYVAQRSTHIQNLFVVCWGMPEPTDCARIQRLIPELRARAGKPLEYISVMPADAPTLGEPERKLLLELTDAVLPYCRRMTIVIEARGFRGAILRSTMTAVTLLARRHDMLRVVDSIDAAIELSAEHLPPRPMVRQALHEVGCELARARVAS